MGDTATTTAGSLPASIESARAALSDESLRVETLRGLACVLLVAFHVIGSHATSGLHVGEDSIYRQFANLFVHLRMPLFTFLSGFVYAYRPAMEGQVGAFARKKLIRLLLPLICVSTLYFVVAQVTPDSTGKMPLHEIWRIYFFPYVHFWFLQAIILVFAVVVLLESVQLLANILRFAVVLAIAMALHLYVRQRNADIALFSCVEAAYLAPFFLLGLGANRFRNAVLQPALIRVNVACFLAAMALHFSTIVAHGAIAQPGTALGLFIGVSGTLTLVYFFPHLRALELLGAYSFTIYLFHPFFVAASRAALKFAHMYSTELGFTVGLVAGVLGPPILEHALRAMPLPRRLLLGQR
jgi:surface polysaccharide O-acyltransferase-like enzyme